ncbi:MAG: amidohydrolase family protein, partial [Alphaproteobacteria bacterium]|nr:amidohydrolase family protein [Alphaproteobacteria bacterium]
MPETTILTARRVITMDPRCPSATRVAVRDGRILAVGDDDAMADWGPAKRDDRFADKVLMPGFVEAHSHLMAGGVWRFTYAGYHARTAPDGTRWEGLRDIDAVMTRLAEADKRLTDGETLVAWGFDPIFLTSERLHRGHLDRIATARPVVVLHSNFHMITVNSAALALARYDRGSNVEGIGKDRTGEPTGEIRGMAAMFPILRRLGIDFRELTRADSSLPPFARTAQRVGVTTATDL